MFRVIDGLPASTVGVEAIGQVSADDYRDVLFLLVTATTESGEKIRMLYVAGEAFSGFSAAAAWQDTKLGFEHFSAFERLALVTDHKWLRDAVNAFGWMMPGEVRVFEVADRDDAVVWLASTSQQVG